MIINNNKNKLKLIHKLQIIFINNILKIYKKNIFDSIYFYYFIFIIFGIV
jgi:hypothetical protein